jgi:urate oxidase
MHRVFQTDDVLRNIMAFLLPSPTDDDSPGLRTTLYNIALTCTSFTGPAIDALWFYMDNLTPLFELLLNFEDSEDGDMVRCNSHSIVMQRPDFL